MNGLWNGPNGVDLSAVRTFPITVTFGQVGAPGTTKVVLHANGRIEGDPELMVGFLASMRGSEVQLPAVVFWLILRAMREDAKKT